MKFKNLHKKIFSQVHTQHQRSESENIRLKKFSRSQVQNRNNQIIFKIFLYKKLEKLNHINQLLKK